jgi:hypothetical protein
MKRACRIITMVMRNLTRVLAVALLFLWEARLPTLNAASPMQVSGDRDDRAGPPSSSADQAVLEQAALVAAIAEHQGTAKVIGNGLLSIEFHDDQIRDDDLAILAGRHDIVALDIGKTPVTDDGLRHLANLSALRSLDLDCNRISDAGVAHLQNLVNIRSLKLGGTGVTDAGVVHLKGMRNLRHLSIGVEGLTDAGVQDLAQFFPRLRVLELSGAHVTRTGLEALHGLEDLTELRLTSPMTDKELRLLGTFRGLRVLHLNGRGLSSEGLDALRQLTRLEQLAFFDLDVEKTQPGLTRLRMALPNLRVYNDYMPLDEQP